MKISECLLNEPVFNNLKTFLDCSGSVMTF